MRLRATIKSKEDLEEQNNSLIAEMNQYRSKYLESQKKAAKSNEQV